MVDARERLEQADEKNFRFEQGRVHELRFFLELEDTAKAVLDRERTPKRIPAIDSRTSTLVAPRKILWLVEMTLND